MAIRPLPLLAAFGCLPWLGAADDNDYDRNLASFGAWGHPVSIDTQAQDGLVPGEGLQIRWVRPGGPAAQMGLQPGDVLLSLNGNQIGSRLDLRNTVIANAPGSAATAVVVHPGGDVSVLDGAFGERRTNRPLRPLTDDWEQRVKQDQLEELDRRARALQELADATAALDPDGTLGDPANADGATAGAAGADAANGAAGAIGDGSWFVNHRWQSPEPAASAALDTAPSPAPAASDERPWRFVATVDGGAR